MGKQEGEEAGRREGSRVKERGDNEISECECEEEESRREERSI